MSLADRVTTFRDVAAVIREPMRLAVRRTQGHRTIGRYHLRGSGTAVHLRHDVLDDMATLLQTFRLEHNALPAGARARLEDLDRPPRAMDLGANIGMFGAWFFSLYPDGQVTAYEAEPQNAHVHRLTVDANVPRLRWEVNAAAAATADGELRFVSGRGAHSRLATDAEAADDGVVVVPAHDVLARAGDVDLLKLDVEGAEWALLADPRFAELPARVVALEYHAHSCAEPSPETAARHALTAMGFEVEGGEFDDAPPGHGMLWAWRR